MNIKEFKQLCKDSKFCEQHLTSQIESALFQLGSISQLPDNWDGYNAAKFSKKQVKNAKQILLYLKKWFTNNIGLLNNRLFKIDISVFPCDIYIDIKYDWFKINIFCDVSEAKISCEYEHYQRLKENTAIFERDSDMYVSCDFYCVHIKNVNYTNIEKALNGLFFKKTWKKEFNKA